MSLYMTILSHSLDADATCLPYQVLNTAMRTIRLGKYTIGGISFVHLTLFRPIEVSGPYLVEEGLCDQPGKRERRGPPLKPYM